MAEVLEIAPVIRALDAIESGDADERALHHDRQRLGHRGAHPRPAGPARPRGRPLTRRLDTLSGGQVVSLGLAAQLLKRPDVLLLDEPTNNLDLDARRKLYDVLEDWNGCLLLVSHDRALLDRMDRIAELDQGEIRSYGGNFTAYEEAVRAAREVAEKNVRNAEQEVKREKRELQQARERAARRAGNAARNLKDAGPAEDLRRDDEARRPGVGGKGERDPRRAGRRRQGPARRGGPRPARRAEDHRWNCRAPTSRPDARSSSANACGSATVGGPCSPGEGADLAIRGPERIALTGSNGSGKSTLLRLINGDLEPEGGRAGRADGRVAYLSQRLDLLDLDRTVAENLAAFAPRDAAGRSG